MAPALLETVLTEAAALIDDVDLHLTHLALRVTISVIGAADATGAPTGEQWTGNPVEIVFHLSGG